MKQSTRLAPVVGEALRDIIGGTTHALALTLLLAFLTVATTGLDLISIARIERQASDYVTTGGATTILDYPGHIDGQACDRLSQVSGVLASGAVKTANGKLTPAATPSNTIPSYEISPGAVRIFRTAVNERGETDTIRDGGILLSHDAATPLAIRSGGQFTTVDDDTVHVLDVYQWPDDGRQTTYSYAALIPAQAAQTFDQCWITTWPTPKNTSELLRTSITGDISNDTDGSKPKTLALNTSQGSSLDAAGLYQQRLTGIMPTIMSALCFILALIMVRARRLEIASSLHAGLPKASLALQHLIETFVWSLSAMLIAAAPLFISATYLIPTCDLPTVLTATFATTAVAALTGTTAGTILAILIIRERHLFVYFKNR